MHSNLITETGGSGGIRDEQLLESAINAPFQTFDNIEVFPSIQQKAARLGYHLITYPYFCVGKFYDCTEHW